jgi:autotransporter-associated beta strand protein
MNKIQPKFRILLAQLAGVLALSTAQAATTTWNATGGNWSLGGNWNTLAAPGASDDVIFGNTGAGTPTAMDASRTINSLNFSQDNQSLHTTTINLGQTLTINRATTGDILYVGSTSAATTASTLTPVTITGAGGTLMLSGTGDLVVRQGNGTAGSHMATLDLSGLDTFNATVGRLLVGQANAGAAVNRPSGTLILAKTNHITLSGGSPQVMIQDAGQNANGGTASVLTFGQVNDLFGDVMRLAGQKGNANLGFNGAFSLPSLRLRNADGVSRVSTVDFGYNGAANSGNSTVCVADFSSGQVDILANLVNLAQGNPGPSSGTCTSTLTIGAGTFDVNNLEIGWGNATGANGAATATFNVNNNGLYNTGAVLVVNNNLRLARTNGGTGAIVGTLNVNGGTVVASNILAGGGSSTINLGTGGKLIVSGTAGSLATPIRVFSLSDASLTIPASNGGATIAVSNLTVGGTQNLINITAVPPISSYPATFPLITYQSGAGGNFALGALPAASPSYTGTLVDTGNGVVSLRLTGGPVVDLSLRWTGAMDGNWDSFTVNWLYQGHATNFFPNTAALFTDSTTQSNVSLNEALSPGSVTVSNNSLQYTFTGAGNIAGASALVKQGTSSLVLANEGLDVFGNVFISGGTLQLGNGDTNGSISAINITNNGALVVNRSDNLTLSSAITGTGGITKNGNGTLILSGACTYTGNNAVNGGALEVDGTLAGSGSVTVASGTVLAGSGTVNGPVTVAGRLNPGSASTTGTFRAHGGLTLSPGAALTFDLSATDPSNPAVNDSVEVLGNLAVNNNVITVHLSGTPSGGSSYLLFTYSGSLSGSFNPTIAGTHFPMTVDTSTPGSVYLTVTGGAGADLKWNSLSDSTWDSVTTNWYNLHASVQSVFYAGDSALLDDTAGVVNGITLAAGVTVAPSVLTNSSSANFFSITGAGRIGGNAGLVKSGLSTLALGTANTFTGPVEIQQGTLRTDNDSALGSTVAGTTIDSGATLDFNGHNLGGEVLTVSGSGVNGEGAIINSGGTQFQAVRQIVLAGDATFGGAGLWAINNGGGAASLSTGGNAYSITKVGANQVNLAQLATVDPALADIDIQQGTIEFSGLTPNMGDPTRTNTVRAGATVAFANGAVAWNKQFVFNGDGTTTTVNNGNGGNTELAGPVELHGACVFNAGGTLLTVSSVISGDGGLTKNGASPMILSGINTYTGDTLINSAALRLNGNGSVSLSSNIVIAAGATLTATGRVDTMLTLASGQTLKGNGAINGKVTASAGSMVAPGVDAIGALAISNAVVLAGTTTMELDQANGTNDVLSCNSSITYGGTLNLVNLGGPLSGGATFKLFNAASYLGAFSSITPPTPGPGQTWDISALGTTGTIRVAGGGGSGGAPRFTSITVSGNNVVMAGTNGVSLGNYYVLLGTNVASPRSTWPRIATNSFDSNGNFRFTNSINAAVRGGFFSLQLP